MSAYASVVSILKTLSQLQNNPSYPYPLISTICKVVDSLRCILEENREVKREFEIKIRDAIYEAQDIIDSDMWSSNFHSQEAEIHQDLTRVMRIIYFRVSMPAEKFNRMNLDRKISVSVWKKFGDIKRPVFQGLVGRDDNIRQLLRQLMRGSPELQVLPIAGIAGIGKTALAKLPFSNSYVQKHFDICGFIKLPIHDYKKRDVLLGLLKSMKNSGDGIQHMTDDQVAKHFYNFLRHKRYLVLLDDIRDVAVWNDLKVSFPDHKNGSRILLTTRNVVLEGITPHVLEPVKNAYSFILLMQIVFTSWEKSPREIRVIAKDIAYSCRGLPLAVVIVGRLLRCAELSIEYWEIVLSSIKTRPSLTGDNNVDLIEALVSLTYKHLPQQLKACLMYMAMFPYDCEIPCSKLLDLWSAEGFTESHVAWDCLEELHQRALIDSKFTSKLGKERCRILDEVFHDFFMRTAKEENFFAVINKETNYGSSLQEECHTYNQQRRLFIHKNIVPFVIHNNYSNKSISTVRSLIYYGPEHQYPLGTWLEDFKLLRILDALNIRFYQFPPEVLNFIHLTYLALSYNGELPTTVCELYNLRFLIVLRNLSVKWSGAPSYLPVEIWNMDQLRHLQVMGSDLPEPPSDTDLLLENLSALLDVGAHSCTSSILERIPNLHKLGILIESLPEDESLSFFSHIHILRRLSIFQCVIMYPNVGSPIFPCPVPDFPSTLTRLTLSGCGFPWINMSRIAALPNLISLELRTYAFQGPDWEVKKDEFPNLLILILEDNDLKNWILADKFCFPKLAKLHISHCYRLREIPREIGDIPKLRKLRVVDCSMSAMNSVLKIQEEKLRRGKDSVKYELYSSHDD